MNLLIKLISVGWGSTGYYGAEVLERDGANAFPAETKILNTHINNNAKSAARQGQGVSGDDLVGKLVEPAFYDANGEHGAGLYGRVQIYKDYVDKWGAEKLKDMQFSIFALATWAQGSAESREGLIAQSLEPTSLNTVDAVVFGGAGGRTVAVESAEFCNDGDCPITNISVMAVEATLFQRITVLRRAFEKQFPSETREDGSTIYRHDYFSDGDDEYIYISNWQADVNYRASYTESGGAITIASRDNWQVVNREIVYTVAESHNTNQRTPQVGSASEDKSMDLQAALARIAELEAEQKVTAAENTQLKTELSQAQTAFNTMSSRYKVLVAKEAVNDTLSGVSFRDDESRGLVVEKLAASVQWNDDGVIAVEALTEAAKPYVEGTSALVVTAESTNYGVPTYESYTGVRGNQGGGNESQSIDILKSAVEGDFSF